MTKIDKMELKLAGLKAKYKEWDLMRGFTSHPLLINKGMSLAKDIAVLKIKLQEQK